MNNLIKEGKIVRYGKFYRYKPETQIKEESGRGKMINKNVLQVTGKFIKYRNHGIVIPDSNIIRRDIYISISDSAGANTDDKVVCEILNTDETTGADSGKNFYEEYFNRYIEPEGRIIQILGKAGETDTEFLSILKKYNLKKEFPAEVNREANKFNRKISTEERYDIRNLNCFTIDPEDAKDFDDAVSIEKMKNSEYRLGIHIADVSYYVKENTALDREASNRGTSVYLINQVVPMLPEKLSNDLCSLKPGQDRLTYSVFIIIDKKSNVKSFEVKKTLINSKRRFTYEEVQKIIETGEGEFSDEILLMNKIAKQITDKRILEGSIDFESPDIKYIFDRKGNIKDIKVKHRLDSMRLIEEFMLLTNRCITELIKDRKKKDRINYPFIYRVHDKPDEEKLKDLSEFIIQFGYNFNLKSKKSIKQLLEKIKNKPEEYIINNLLIRSMAKAIYTHKNIGHYGLGFENYTHFTSPIRRYPDLYVHRILNEYLNNADDLESKIRSYRNEIKNICKQCSITEQNAVIAEREAGKLKQVEYIRKHIGEEYEGIISGIIRHGLFVEIADKFIEGMVRFRDMEDDFYEYDEKNHCAIGRRRKKLYRAGQKVRIRVINADMEKRKIDFVLI